VASPGGSPAVGATGSPGASAADLSETEGGGASGAGPGEPAPGAPTPEGSSAVIDSGTRGTGSATSMSRALR
jgi:hypothetical protein